MKKYELFPIWVKKIKGLEEIQFVSEYKFDPKRKWRFDFAHVGSKTAVEIEGGVYTNGRHTRPTGFINDMDKYNWAALRGWRVYRCIPDMLFTENTANFIKDLVSQNQNPH